LTKASKQAFQLGYLTMASLAAGLYMDFKNLLQLRLSPRAVFHDVLLIRPPRVAYDQESGQSLTALTSDNGNERWSDLGPLRGRKGQL
jgi:hypothetical protein